MNLTNFHSHTNYCDGKEPMEAFVLEAIKQGFTAYGFSSHAPLPFDTKWTMKRNSMQAYLEEATQLKRKYADRIALYVGLEIDYLGELHHAKLPYFQNLPLDYRIGSIHFLYDQCSESFVDIDCSASSFGHSIESKFGGDIAYVVHLYFSKMKEMIALGGIDFVGHCDKIYKNAMAYSPNLRQEKWYQELLLDYFKCIAAARLPIEVNTKAYAKDKLFFPHRDHFQLLKEMNIPVLVNSDAHSPEKLNWGRREALKELRKNGITKILEMHQNQWKEVSIDLCYS